ncbi:MAG TPA: PQQ-binding-like beta-propeller repeat protein [Rhodopila sp.]
MPRPIPALCIAFLLAWPAQPHAQPEAAPDEGFSPLDEITPANVKQLVAAFTFRTGKPRAHTSAPLAVGDVLLVLTPFPHTLFGLDLTQPNAPVKWTYAPRPNHLAEGLTCCGAPTGGIAAQDGRIYLNSLDGQVSALAAADGKVLWNATVAHPEAGEILATAPLPVMDELIVGTSGDDAGARGALIALDASSGGQRWKVFSTGPDNEAGIGESFHPFYRTGDGPDLGVTTWPPAAWQQGGGGLAGPLVFDPGSGMLFQQTGHPAPLNPDQREGDNLWTSGLFARDARTGAATWFDAIDPHDVHSLGAGGGIILATSQGRPILIHPDANGYLYELDRTSGEILSANPYLPVTATHGVDRATGRPVRDANFTLTRGSTTRDICPGWPAGSNALPAFSALSGFAYLPVAQLCMDMQPVSANYIAGTPFAGANVRMKPAAGRSLGALIGWDIAARHAAWTLPESLPLRGGALVTGGGLVFYGTLDGFIKAADARTGTALWQFHTASGIVARPISYRAPDGHQYLAVLAGSGGLTGTNSAQEIDARDATAAHGLAAALGPLPTPDDASGVLYVFRLP